MLTINNLQVSYGKKIVLKNLEIRLENNKIHGLVGLNGSGKTTLFKIIFQLLKPDVGSVKWNDETINRKQIAFLETQNFFYSNITVREHLSLFNPDNKAFNLDQWQSILKLPLDELVENYSTGMRKKLAILSVLKLDKPILLLDEPFNEVDLETSRIIKILLDKLREKGKTIIISSHIIETLINSCDYIHHLESKSIKKTYHKEDYQGLEQELFEEYEKRIKNDLDQVL